MHAAQDLAFVYLMPLVVAPKFWHLMKTVNVFLKGGETNCSFLNIFLIPYLFFADSI